MISIMNICIPTDIPDSAKPTFDAIKSIFTESAAGAAVNDLDIASKAIKISIAMGLVYCLVFIYMMSAFAEIISWIIIVLLQVSLIGATAYGYLAYDEELTKCAAFSTQYEGDALTTKTEESEKMQLYMMIGTGVIGLITLIFGCMICCQFDSLKKAIDVIDAAADFLAGTKRVILVPCVYFMFSLIAIFCWAGSMACVLSLNEIYPSENIPQGKDLVWDDKVWYMAWYMLFGILWITAFFEYCSSFVVMVSASSYYFNSGPEGEGSAEVGLGFKYSLVHSGSIAIGAFIIALVRFIRIVFYYLAK